MLSQKSCVRAYLLVPRFVVIIGQESMNRELLAVLNCVVLRRNHISHLKRKY